MITPGDVVWIVPVGSRTPLTGRMTRAAGEQWLERYRRRGNRGPVAYEIVPVPVCNVCGEIGRQRVPGQFRCIKHWNRNPCVIEGCKRSRAARWISIGDLGTKVPDLNLDDVFCGEHWRAFVPVGSPERRIYNRFFRRAKRYGWRDDGTMVNGDDPRPDPAAYYRIWGWLVSRARARARGDIDESEIKRIMGW